MKRGWEWRNGENGWKENPRKKGKRKGEKERTERKKERKTNIQGREEESLALKERGKYEKMKRRVKKALMLEEEPKEGPGGGGGRRGTAGDVASRPVAFLTAAAAAPGSGRPGARESCEARPRLGRKYGGTWARSLRRQLATARHTRQLRGFIQSAVITSISFINITS